MTYEQWNNLKDGDRVHSDIDDTLTVWWYDFYEDGEKIMCLCSEHSIWPAWQFDPEDWELVGE